MQPTETPDNSKNGNEGEVVLMKRKGGPEDAPKEATNGSASPSDALNSASVLRVSNPTNAHFINRRTDYAVDKVE